VGDYDVYAGVEKERDMKKPMLLFLAFAIIAYGCGDGSGEGDADAAEATEDQEAVEEIISDGDVPEEDSHAEFDPEEACLDSGGTVDTML